MAFSDDLGFWFADFFVKQNLVLTGDSSSGVKSVLSRAGIIAELANKANTSITVTGTGMLAGGGNLTTNRTLNLAAISAYNTYLNATGSSAVPTAVTMTTFKGYLSLTSTDVGLGNVPNVDATNRANHTGTQAISTIVNLQTSLDAKEATANKGVANGYAGLDGSGKVPTSQLPASIVGGVVYQGGWNATTNSPTIPSATAGNKGWYYIVTTAGSTSVGGITDWKVGDWVISDGAAWTKVDNTDQVTSVAGKTGVVTLTNSDVGLGNVPNVDATNRANHTGTQAQSTVVNLTTDLAARALNTITVTGTGMLAGGGNLTANRTITLAATAAFTVLMNNTSASAVPTAVTMASLKTALALTKADVGLGNVQNVDQTNASNITSGTIGAAYLPNTVVTTNQSTGAIVANVGSQTTMTLTPTSSASNVSTVVVPKGTGNVYVGTVANDNYITIDGSQFSAYTEDELAIDFASRALYDSGGVDNLSWESRALYNNWTATTQSSSDNSTKLATTAFVQSVIGTGLTLADFLTAYGV